jgi:hypothetical protein
MIWKNHVEMVTFDKIQETLTRYGDAGFELVAAVPLVASNIRYGDYRLFFKKRAEPGLR